jgi:hypothetical protein
MEIPNALGPAPTPPTGFVSVYDPRSANHPMNKKLVLNVADAAAFYASNTASQRPTLWMPPDAHADIGLLADAQEFSGSTPIVM